MHFHDTPTSLPSAGHAGLALGPSDWGTSDLYRWQFSSLRTVANTIEGGSSEIQCNIIATRGLRPQRG